ncbi:MAG: MFS transporter [Croceibacterium sp.]
MAAASEQPDQQRVPAGSWYALGVLTLVYLVNFVDRQILSILANDIKADLGLDDAQLGFLYGTAFAIFYALFGIPLGRLADSWNRTRLLALGLTLWSAMTALSGLARSFAGLAVARVGVGVGEATASPCAYSLISDLFPRHRRATALSIYSAGLFFGSGLSLVVGAAIVQAWNRAWPQGAPLGLAGWQAAFLAVGLPGLLLALWVLTLREPVRGAVDGLPDWGMPRPWADFGRQLLLIVPPLTLLGAARGGARALVMNLIGAGVIGLLAWVLAALTGGGAQFLFLGIGAYAVFSWASALYRDDRPTFALTWGTPVFMATVFTYGAISYVGYTLTYWAAPYGERVFGLGKLETAWWLGAPAALGGVLGVIAGGWAADWLHRRTPAGRLLVVLVGVLGPVPLVLLAYRTTSADLFLLCSFLLQAVTSSALGASAAATQALVLPRMRGTATAIFFLGATLIGLGLGPFMAGFISEASGSLGVGVQASLLIVPLGLAALVFAQRGYGLADQTRVARAVAAGEQITPA